MTKIKSKQQSNNGFGGILSLSYQIMILLGLSTWGGWYLDKRFIHGMPIFIWILPLWALVCFLIKLVYQTTHYKKKS